MFKSYRFRLVPNKEQAELLNKWEGHTRWLWNRFLDLNQKEYASNKKFIWRYDLINLIPELKKQNEWLKEAPSQSLQQIGQYKPSSKTCSSCGYKMSDMGLKIRDWICPECGAEHDRDVNAALNILWWGLLATPNTAGMAGIDACGDAKPLVDDGHMTEVDEVSMKQEAYGSLVRR